MARELPASSRWAAIALSGAILCTSTSALAQSSPAAQRGLTFVRVHCVQCHAIGKVDESPLTIAPAFRTLHLKFPVETLRRRLSEGIIAGHPTMPQFRLDADQLADVIAYLETLER
jgi:mono/diheme cytochrome c family protein